MCGFDKTRWGCAIISRSSLLTPPFHFQIFLSSLKPPMSVPEDKLTRWHPNFNVDSVPAVQASLLPQPPRADKLATAQEVLDKAHSLITPKVREYGFCIFCTMSTMTIFWMNWMWFVSFIQMEKALLSLVQKAEDKSAPSKETSRPNVNCTQTSAPLRIPNALNGVSQSLLDRVCISPVLLLLLLHLLREFSRIGLSITFRRHKTSQLVNFPIRHRGWCMPKLAWPTKRNEEIKTLWPKHFNSFLGVAFPTC